MMHFAGLIVLTGVINPAQANEISIPDVALNTVIREAVQKPVGPLTEQDLLSLTNLNASSHGIRSIDGLEAAQNLTSLNLSSNRLSIVSITNGLTELNILDLSFNPLTTLGLSADMTKLTELELSSDELTSLTLPPG